MADIIATCGGYELVEDGPRLVFVDRGTNGYDVAIFVFALLTFILTMNAVVMVLMVSSGEVPYFVPILVVVLAIGCGLALRAVLGARRVRKARPLAQLPVLLVLDRAHNAVVDRTGRPLAALDGAVVQAVFQVGSSGKALRVSCAAGNFVVARGNHLSGGVEEIEDALRARGLRVA